MTTKTPMPPLRAYEGPALISYGFRPFFLLGSIYAGLAVLVWLPIVYGEMSLHSAFAPRDWHVHEMLYGYLPAVITGFLFTAIPNWTGQLPIQGKPLLALVLVWVAGRVVVTISADVGWLAAAAIDVGFLALIVAAAAREILAGSNGATSRSSPWSRCFSRETPRSISRPTSAARPITAFGPASPSWCC